MNFSDVYVFKKIAATMSFTKAARITGLSRSAVSKQLKRLEEDLGVVLINRNTRSVTLTESGRTFDTETEGLDTTIEHAASLVRGSDLASFGTISCLMPSALGSALMPSVNARFRPNAPALTLKVNYDDGIPDVVAEGLDFGLVTTTKLDDSTLVARRLLTTNLVYAASPKYLRDHGLPDDPADLASHDCIGFRRKIAGYRPWQAQIDGQLIKLRVNFTTLANSSFMLVVEACLHTGILCVPRICIAGEIARNVLRVIPNLVDPTPYGVYALYPHHNAATRVKPFVDFIEETLQSMDSGNQQEFWMDDLVAPIDSLLLQ
jgi:DNA-binding transcriptional LysR family regulator